MNGQDVKALRDRLGMTQMEFAVALGVDTGSVSKWERGAPISRLAERVLRELATGYTFAAREAAEDAD